MTMNNPYAPFDAALELALNANCEAALAEDVGSADLTASSILYELTHYREYYADSKRIK